MRSAVVKIANIGRFAIEKQLYRKDIDNIQIKNGKWYITSN